MRSVEYLFTSHIDVADAFARRQGWRPYGRVQWQKRDGAVVTFLSLLAQLEIVAAGETVHLIGQAREARRIVKRQRAVAVCHPIA
jgi:hypothetical protein